MVDMTGKVVDIVGIVAVVAVGDIAGKGSEDLVDNVVEHTAEYIAEEIVDIAKDIDSGYCSIPVEVVELVEH